MFEDPAKKEQIERVWKTYGLLKVEYGLFRENVALMAPGLAKYAKGINDDLSRMIGLLEELAMEPGIERELKNELKETIFQMERLKVILTGEKTLDDKGTFGDYAVAMTKCNTSVLMGIMGLLPR